MDLSSELMPVRMKKLRLLILDDYVEEVLIALQHLGYVHIIDMRDRIARWENMSKPYEGFGETRFWEDILSRLEAILKELNIMKELGLLEQIFKPEERKLIEVSLSEEMRLISRVERLVEKIENDIKENISTYRMIRDFLVELRGLEINIERLSSSKELNIVVGQTSPENISLIERDLERRAPYASLYSHGEGRRRFAVVISLKPSVEEVNSILEERGFEKIDIPEELTGSPTDCLGFIDGKMIEAIKRNEDLSVKLYDAVKCKIERLRSMEKLGKTERIYTLEGWIPKGKEEEVEKVVLEASRGYARTLIVEPDEPERYVPTLLRDRKILSSFTVITEMYGMPSYNEIDPTPFIAIFFTFFVGLMLGDISLGTILLVGGLLIIRGAGSRSHSMASLGRILVLSGISAAIFGVLTGQFMGGALEMLTDGKVTIPVFWMSPADAPIAFMFTVLMIGVFHILVGVVLGLVNNYMDRNIRGMIGDQLSMFLLIIGAAILVSTRQYRFEGYGIAGYTVLVAGLVALLLGKGLMGLLEITKIVSNIISYVRILALNMASAWMGRTFVLLASMLVNVPYFGLPASIALLIFSQLFLLFISSFSTFAHSMRLHYVEFFGRFFIGGGTKFSPLQCRRLYTILKMEGAGDD